MGEGYKVYKYKRGYDALRDVETLFPDLVLLDLMLPDISGLEICKKIKDSPKTSDIPVIILSARSDEYDILTGFNFGCYDYITKPFSEKVLIARIKSALANTHLGCPNCKKHFNIVKINDLVINSITFETTIKNKAIDLTPLEFKLLHFLAKNINKVFTREQIFEELYAENDENRSDRSIDILINRVRKKIGAYGKNIETIYGVGYSFKISK